MALLYGLAIVLGLTGAWFCMNRDRPLGLGMALCGFGGLTAMAAPRLLQLAGRAGSVQIDPTWVGMTLTVVVLVMLGAVLTGWWLFRRDERGRGR